jgi:hypothetical protein
VATRGVAFAVLSALTASAVTATAGAQDDPVAWEGPYKPIAPTSTTSPYHSCCEISHAILIGKEGPSQGKVLIIQSDGRRWLWDPASPNSVSVETFHDNLPENLFCAGHSVDGEGNVIVHGGNRYRQKLPNPIPNPWPCSPPWCGPQPTWSGVYDPTALEWQGAVSMIVPTYHVPPPNFQNFGYYYPGSVRLPDGRVLSAGGGSAPLTVNDNPNRCCDTGGNYFVNGWQYFDPATPGGAAWKGQTLVRYFDGLPAPYEFNYYPLLAVMPEATNGQGRLFAAVVTDNRNGNSSDSGHVPKPSVSASMDLVPALGSAPWQLATTQIMKTVPGGPAVPRNLYYPNGFLWPLQLDAMGQLAAGSLRRFVVLGGCDYNDYLSDTAANPFPPHPDGGRPTMPKTYTIDNPDAGGVWTDTVLPPPNFPRIYGNAVLLPDKQVFLVGGAPFDFRPFAGQGAGSIWQRERKAVPILTPELLDLTNPVAWAPCDMHESPRLYHSIAVLLPDGRVLVGGGYRGAQNVDSNNQIQPPSAPEHFTWSDWKEKHSNFEIFSPAYMFVGKRPQLSMTGNTIAYGQDFEVTVSLVGSTTPASTIESVCLMSPGSVTHHYDWDQRYVGLHHALSATHPATKLVITPPANAMLAPPGWYMLFLTTAAQHTSGVRVPSIAKFVHLQ